LSFEKSVFIRPYPWLNLRVLPHKPLGEAQQKNIFASRSKLHLPTEAELKAELLRELKNLRPSDAARTGAARRPQPHCLGVVRRSTRVPPMAQTRTAPKPIIAKNRALKILQRRVSLILFRHQHAGPFNSKLGICVCWKWKIVTLLDRI
jgi:hypothetical protein